jgi:transposase
LPIKPRDRAALDLAMLIAGETSGRPLDEILAEFQRSRSTYFEKLRLFRERGLAGLLPRPTGPRQPWRRPLSVVAQIVMCRLRDPGRSAEAIAAELAQRQVRVSVRSIERTLSEFGLTRGRAEPSLLAEEVLRAR